jgi:hypothetical protein
MMTKRSKKYVTIKDEGMDFRKMAKVMSDHGFSMNHATSRNQLILAIETIVQYLTSNTKSKMTKKNIKDFLSVQENHDILSDVIFLAYKELEKEEKENE